jgi:hypothetical protein
MVVCETGTELSGGICAGAFASVLRKIVDKLKDPIPMNPAPLHVTRAVCLSGFGVNVQLAPVSHLIVLPSQFAWKLCVP